MLSYEDLKKYFERGLKEFSLTDLNDLYGEIEDTKNLIKEHTANGKRAKAENAAEFLRDLEIVLGYHLDMEKLKKEVTEETSRSSNSSPNMSTNAGNADELNLMKEKVFKELASLHDTYKQMPECVERSLIYLLYLCTIKKEEITGMQPPHTVDESIRTEFTSLRELIKTEGVSANVNAALTMNQIYTQIMDNNWVSCIKELRKMIKTIQPFDIQELFRLITEAQKAADMIRGQDVILFVGSTGTGKSTTIHYLGGSTMAEIQVEIVPGEYKKHIGPVKLINDQLRNITCSPFAESETRYITPVVVNFRDIGGEREGSTILCDAPGFDDTSGAEVDIANGLGLINAIHGCNSIRLVILVSHLSIGDRGDGVKNLVKLLAGMVKNMYSNLDSFQYLFTKYPQDANIYVDLINIKNAIDKNPEMSSDRTLLDLFEDMTSKARNRQVKIVDPLNGDPYKILAALTRANAITNPANVFQFQTSGSSYEILKNQCTLHKLNIMSAIERSNYKLVTHKLKELKKLAEIFENKNEHIVNIYQECVQIIANSIQRKYNDTIGLFDRFLENLNVLTVEDINQYKTCFNELNEAEMLVPYLGSQCIQSNSLKQYLDLKVDGLLANIKSSESDRYIVKSKINNLKLLSDFFKEEKPKYDEACKFIYESIQNRIKSIEFSKTAEKIASQLTDVVSLYKFFKDHIDVTELEKGYHDCIERYKDVLQENSSKSIRMLNSVELTKEVVKQIGDAIDMLESAAICTEMRIHVNKKDLSEIYKKFLNEIDGHFNSITKQIDDCFKNHRENSFKEIKMLTTRLDSLREIPIICQRTANEYHATTQAITGYIKQLKDDVEKLIFYVHEHKEKINYTKLFNCLNGLQNAEWFDQIRPGYFSDVMKEIRGDLIIHATKLHDNLLDADLGLANYQELQEAYNGIFQLGMMIPFEENVPGLKKLREEAELFFEKSVIKNLNLIKEAFSLETKGCNKFKKELQDLEKLKIEYENMHPAQAFLRDKSFNSIELLKGEIASLEKARIDSFNAHISELSTSLQKLQLVGQSIYQKSSKEEQEILAAHEFKTTKELCEKISEIKTRLELMKIEEYASETLDKINELKSIEKAYNQIPKDKIPEEAIALLKSHGFQSINQLQKKVELKQEDVSDTESLAQDYLVSRLDFIQTEMALCYLSKCVKLRPYKDLAYEAFSLLKSYIQVYLDTTEYETQNLLNKIEFLNESQMDRGFDYAQKLRSRLDEIREYETNAQQKYPQLHGLIGTRLSAKSIDDALTTLCATLRDEVQEDVKKQNTRGLEIKQVIAKALSIVKEPFDAIYKEIRQELYKEVNDKYKNCMELIEKTNFYDLSVELTQIEEHPLSERLLSKIKHTLAIKISGLIQETKNKVILLGKDLNSKDVSSIVENLDKLSNAEKHIFSYSDENNNNNNNNKEKMAPFVESNISEQVKKAIKDIEKNISKKLITYLNIIEALTSTNDFYEAELKQEHINQVRQILQNYCMDEEVNQKFENAANTLETTLKKIETEYSDMPINAYLFKQPRHIIERLSKVTTNNTKYTVALATIKSSIKKNIEDELKIAKEKPEIRRERMRDVEFAIKSLPDDLSQAFEKTLDIMKTEIAEVNKADESKCKEILQTGEPIHIFKHMKECSDLKKENVVYIIRDNVLHCFNALRAKLNESFEHNEFSAVQEPFRKLKEYYSYFGESIMEVKTVYKSVQRQLFDRFASICALYSNIENLENEKAERSIDMFFSLVELLNSSKNDDVELSKDFERTFLKAEQEICDYFIKINQKYQKAFAEMQIENLCDCLKIMNSWDKFITRILGARRTYDARMTFEKLNDVVLFSKMVDKIVERLESIKLAIYKFEPLQESEAICDKFYESLNQQISVIIQVKMFEDFISKKKIDCEQFENNCLNHLNIKIDEMSEKAKKIIKNDAMRNKDYDDIHSTIQNLTSFDKYCKSTLFCLNQKIKDIKLEIDLKITNLSEIVNNDEVKNEDVGENLIKLKLIGDNIISFRDSVNKLIDSMLITVKRKDVTGTKISCIATYLQRDVRGVGQIILQEHSTFKGEAISFFNIETKRKDIIYVLENLGDCSYLNQFCEEKRDSGCKVTISKTNEDKSEKLIEAGCNKSKNRSCYCDVKKLYDAYNEFDKEYKYLLREYLFNRMERNEDQNRIVNELVDNARLQTGDSYNDDQNDNITWNSEIKKKIPKLLAYIFAVWTIKNSEYYIEMKSSENKNNYLLQPHPAQVVAILRILSIGYREVEKSGTLKSIFDYLTNNKDVLWRDISGLVNNLAQILTGQGKSVVLAVTSIALALFGIEVSCACYSEYLSKRDLEAFTGLFEAFGVSDRIKYGTFNKICENIINENGEVRQQIIDLVMNSSNTRTRRAIKRPKVLLIDEVDIFFTKLFYGNVYTPVARLQDPLIIKLVDSIWKRRNESLTLKSIETQDEYRNCCARFKGWEFLIREAVKTMCVEIKDYKHEYIVSNNKIAYYEHDSISYNISYGYKTLFAYYHEYEEKKITRESLEKNICIEIHCGSFSYAEIPRRFLKIMGVTGTLETLNKNEAEIVKNEYKIDRFSIIPSVYSDNKLTFAKYSDVFIENKDSYFITLVEKIEEKLKEKDYKRAVLVFFETPKKLDEFYYSSQFITFRDRALKITEELTIDEKEKNIKRSTTAGQVTLATSSFGRGTDFICRDQNVLSNGGLHVIQTFLSENYSDEVQMKGRTARQGQSGSYSMVLLDEDLEKYLGPSYKKDIEELRSSNKIYDGLQEAARKSYEKKFSDLAKFVEKAKKEHDLTSVFLSAVEGNDIESVKAYLGERNKGATGNVLSRTVCLMDATGSMSSLLLQAKITVAGMFERVTNILKQHKINPDCFQMQFAVYRDYDCGADRILQSSSWESHPNNLRQFMETQTAYGGGDYEEAIEIALWHVNNEHENRPVTQVILIGDAPAKTKKQIEYDRKHVCGGKDYWAHSKYSQATDYEREAQKLRGNGISVHAFYLHRGAKANFERIAELTDGSAHELPIGSPNSSELLTAIVSVQILTNIGDANGNSNELLESYRREYGAVRGYFE